MDTLVIFTTYFINREDDNFLFCQDRIEEVAAKALQKFSVSYPDAFDQGSILYRLAPDKKKQLVFAHPVLELYEKRKEFIATLFADVLACLTEKEKQKIKHLLFILHRKELDSAERFKILRGKQLADHLKIIKEKINALPGLQPNKNGSAEEGELSEFVDFIAFAHEPGHPVHKILAEFKPPKLEGKDIGEYIRIKIENVKKLY